MGEDDDGPCTDCWDTGITIQTERRCACQPEVPMTPDTPSPTQATLPAELVEEVDREAAAGLYLVTQGWPSSPRDLAAAAELRAGERDDWDEVQAFTRHRIAALSAMREENERARAAQPATYAEWQQRRGMLADTVDWAILEYDGFMKDDAYDSQRVLDRIIERLRSTRAALSHSKKEDGQ